MVSADRQVHQVLLVEGLKSRRKRLGIGWGYFSAERGSWERRDRRAGSVFSVPSTKRRGKELL
jgi:hypothetical protein